MLPPSPAVIATSYTGFTVIVISPSVKAVFPFFTTNFVVPSAIAVIFNVVPSFSTFTTSELEVAVCAPLSL